MTRRLIGSFVTVVALVGCSNEMKTYPVKGKVSFGDGSPVPGGQIGFSDPVKQVSSGGIVQQDGTFVLSTYEAGDGAPAGTYKVTVQPPETQGGVYPFSLARTFTDSEKTPLEAVVKEGDNAFDFKVEKQ